MTLSPSGSGVLSRGQRTPPGRGCPYQFELMFQNEAILSRLFFRSRNRGQLALRPDALFQRVDAAPRAARTVLSFGGKPLLAHLAEPEFAQCFGRGLGVRLDLRGKGGVVVRGVSIQILFLLRVQHTGKGGVRGGGGRSRQRRTLLFLSALGFGLRHVIPRN